MSSREKYNSYAPTELQLPWPCQNAELKDNDRWWYVMVRKGLKSMATDGLVTISDFAVFLQEYRPYMQFDGITAYYNGISNAEKCKMLNILKALAALALNGPQLFPTKISLLARSKENLLTSVKFTREQCACLLANSFLCTFPLEGKRMDLNQINMDKILSSESIARQKIPFFLEYFENVMVNQPLGCVTISRRSIAASSFPDWNKMDKPVMMLSISDINIEYHDECLQVDFANKFIGGGVLKRGSLQEEIRFLLRPELIVATFICPQMEKNEAIRIFGSLRFSNYEGYAQTLAWKNLGPRESIEICGEVVAMDAQCYGIFGKQQYLQENLLRELNKAYVGFYHKNESHRPQPRPVATGNWGCGSFGGNKQYKSLIQLMAASALNRNVVFVPYDSTVFGLYLESVVNKLIERGVTIGTLYKTLVAYSPKEGSVFEWVLKKTKQNTAVALREHQPSAKG